METYLIVSIICAVVIVIIAAMWFWMRRDIGTKTVLVPVVVKTTPTDTDAKEDEPTGDEDTAPPSKIEGALYSAVVAKDITTREGLDVLKTQIKYITFNPQSMYSFIGLFEIMYQSGATEKMLVVKMQGASSLALGVAYPITRTSRRVILCPSTTVSKGVYVISGDGENILTDKDAQTGLVLPLPDGTLHSLARLKNPESVIDAGVLETLQQNAIAAGVLKSIPNIETDAGYEALKAKLATAATAITNAPPALSVVMTMDGAKINATLGVTSYGGNVFRVRKIGGGPGADIGYLLLNKLDGGVVNAYIFVVDHGSLSFRVTGDSKFPAPAHPPIGGVFSWSIARGGVETLCMYPECVRAKRW